MPYHDNRPSPEHQQDLNLGMYILACDGHVTIHVPADHAAVCRLTVSLANGMEAVLYTRKIRWWHRLSRTILRKAYQ